MTVSTEIKEYLESIEFKENDIDAEMVQRIAVSYNFAQIVLAMPWSAISGLSAQEQSAAVGKLKGYLSPIVPVGKKSIFDGINWEGSVDAIQTTCKNIAENTGDLSAEVGLQRAMVVVVLPTAILQEYVQEATVLDTEELESVESGTKSSGDSSSEDAGRPEDVARSPDSLLNASSGRAIDICSESESESDSGDESINDPVARLTDITGLSRTLASELVENKSPWLERPYTLRALVQLQQAASNSLDTVNLEQALKQAPSIYKQLSPEDAAAVILLQQTQGDVLKHDLGQEKRSWFGKTSYVGGKTQQERSLEMHAINALFKAFGERKKGVSIPQLLRRNVSCWADASKATTRGLPTDGELAVTLHRRMQVLEKFLRISNVKLDSEIAGLESALKKRMEQAQKAIKTQGDAAEQVTQKRKDSGREQLLLTIMRHITSLNEQMDAAKQTKNPESTIKALRKEKLSCLEVAVQAQWLKAKEYGYKNGLKGNEVAMHAAQVQAMWDRVTGNTPSAQPPPEPSASSFFLSVPPLGSKQSPAQRVLMQLASELEECAKNYQDFQEFCTKETPKVQLPKGVDTFDLTRLAQSLRNTGEQLNVSALGSLAKRAQALGETLREEQDPQQIDQLCATINELLSLLNKVRSDLDGIKRRVGKLQEGVTEQDAIQKGLHIPLADCHKISKETQERIKNGLINYKKTVDANTAKNDVFFTSLDVTKEHSLASFADTMQQELAVAKNEGEIFILCKVADYLMTRLDDMEKSAQNPGFSLQHSGSSLFCERPSHAEHVHGLQQGRGTLRKADAQAKEASLEIITRALKTLESVKEDATRAEKFVIVQAIAKVKDLLKRADNMETSAYQAEGFATEAEHIAKPYQTELVSPPSPQLP